MYTIGSPWMPSILREDKPIGFNSARFKCQEACWTAWSFGMSVILQGSICSGPGVYRFPSIAWKTKCDEWRRSRAAAWISPCVIPKRRCFRSSFAWISQKGPVCWAKKYPCALSETWHEMEWRTNEQKEGTTLDCSTWVKLTSCNSSIAGRWRRTGWWRPVWRQWPDSCHGTCWRLRGREKSISVQLQVFCRCKMTRQTCTLTYVWCGYRRIRGGSFCW